MLVAMTTDNMYINTNTQVCRSNSDLKTWGLYHGKTVLSGWWCLGFYKSIYS